MKFLFYFRVSKTFGPLFKMIQQMTLDLVKFAVIWSIILIMFTCVAVLSFGELTQFHSVFDVGVIFIESALGGWDLKVYDGTTDDGYDV